MQELLSLYPSWAAAAIEMFGYMANITLAPTSKRSNLDQTMDIFLTTITCMGA